MDAKYTDEKINKLIAERKSLHSGWREQLKLRRKDGHKEYDLDILGEHGNMFRLKLRQSVEKPFNFSAILTVLRRPKSSSFFRLLRYNGLHAPHTNPIEGNEIDGYHIHRATERYQKRGFDEDTYTELTDRYVDLEGALICLLEDAGFDIPSEPQLLLL
jgi:hypothetical protein